MVLVVRGCVDRLRISASVLPAAMGCALVLVLTGCNGSSRTSGAVAPAVGGSTYSLMQMNLCLSGLADCYGKAAYPAVVEEAVARIGAAHPDAVTFNEACRGDVARIARRTGYDLRFSRVIYRGEPSAVSDPDVADFSVTRCSPTRPSGALTTTTSRHSRDRAAQVAVRHDPGTASKCAPPT